MHKGLASGMLLLGAAIVFTSASGATGAEKGCPPDQFLVTVYTMTTCISTQFNDEITKIHIPSASPTGIFLDISGSSQRNAMCLRCHRRGKPYSPTLR